MAEVVILTGVFYSPRRSKPADKDLEVNHYRTIGAYRIANHLRNNDISVQVIDFIQFMSQQQLMNLIRKFLPKEGPCILGISSTFMLSDKYLPDIVRSALKIIRKEYPSLKVVVGGTGANVMPLKPNFCDYSIHSYAEDIALDLFNGLLGKTKLNPEYKFNKVLFKENEKFDIVNSDHRFIKEDCIRRNEALPLEISRGCIFKCRFCRFPYIGKKKNDYIKCIDRVKEELLYNYENFGTTNYYVLDDTFNETPQKVEEFYNMTKSLPFKIKYVAYLRADLIHRFPETAIQLKESGLVAAFFGIETFHPEASKLIGKAWSGKEAKDFLVDLRQNIWKDDVQLTISLIVGIPPETLEDCLETHKWLCDNKIHYWGWHVLSMAENKERIDKSEFETNPEKYGFTLLPGGEWSHALYDRQTIIKWFNILIKQNKEPWPSAWRFVEQLNYFPEEFMKKYTTDMYYENLMFKRREWFNQYIKLINEL
jgi:hypothetical protein